jgi:hypothetical protein
MNKYYIFLITEDKKDFVFETFSTEREMNAQLGTGFSRFFGIRLALKSLKKEYTELFGEYNVDKHKELKKIINDNFDNDIETTTFKNAIFSCELKHFFRNTKGAKKWQEIECI